MVTVFQLLLSLVTQQTEDDQHDATNEPGQDNQLEQTQNQSENAEETNPTSDNQGRLDLSNSAAATPEERLEAAHEESERSDVANPSPIATQTGEMEPEASDATADIERTSVFGINTSTAESEPEDVLKDGPDDV
ncbi:MAG: hypothetical protein OXT74_16535, partial [Candidatus Poribacteria bacterium]|nr:hypothetical protein [Candidatus Poribacteria bacterium]